MNRPVIEFSHVKKAYKLFQDRETTLKEKVIKRITLSKNNERFMEKVVLEDFSCSIFKGETIGIIGENGAGKSTTLKLIANIIQPDQGRVNVNGKVASLLEIGAGFQADMTGKENVYLYGTILGLSKKSIDQKYESIVKFAELVEFMHTPVKNYSSGMYMRLAFAVAIHVEPEIVIIDEVLAVGDINFQKKCLDKLEELKRDGKTIVFVSHDMTSVRQLCDRVIYIYKNGKYNIGPTDAMVNLYFTNIYKERSQEVNQTISNNLEKKFSTETNIAFTFINPDAEVRSRWGNKVATIKAISLTNHQGTITNVFQHGSDIVIHGLLGTTDTVYNTVLGIAVYDEENNLISGPNSKNSGLVLDKIEGEKPFKIIMKSPPLLEGEYTLSVALYDYSCREPYDHMEKFFVFYIQNEKEMFGRIRLDCEWIF